MGENMTSGDVAAELAREAKAAAKALDEALNQGCSAEAYELDGAWYVVTSGTGEGYDFAYDVNDVVIDEVSADDWDYSAWCSGVSPTEDKRVAAAYYLLRDGAMLGTAGSCTPVLSDEERAVLDVAREMP